MTITSAPPPHTGSPSMPPGIRLLASTGPLLLSPLGWVMEAIADAGYDAAELVVGLAAESRDPDRVTQLADATGLAIPVVHGPYMLAMRAVLGSGYAQKTHRSMELASAVGAETLVAHAPFRFERRAVRWVTGAHDELSEYPARFAMENLFPVAGRDFSLAVRPEELLDYRHVVFDTSHFAVSGIDLFTAWDVLADRVVHLHVSDNKGNGRDSHAALGSGVLPLGRFLHHVARSGWRGTVTLELDVRAHLEDRATLVAFLAGQRELATRMFAGEVSGPGAVQPDTRPLRAGAPARAEPRS